MLTDASLDDADAVPHVDFPAPRHGTPRSAAYGGPSSDFLEVVTDTFGVCRYYPVTPSTSRSASVLSSPIRVTRRGSGIVAAAAAAMEAQLLQPKVLWKPCNAGVDRLADAATTAAAHDQEHSDGSDIQHQPDTTYAPAATMATATSISYGSEPPQHRPDTDKLPATGSPAGSAASSLTEASEAATSTVSKPDAASFAEKHRDQSKSFRGGAMRQSLAGNSVSDSDRKSSSGNVEQPALAAAVMIGASECPTTLLADAAAGATEPPRVRAHEQSLQQVADDNNTARRRGLQGREVESHVSHDISQGEEIAESAVPKASAKVGVDEHLDISDAGRENNDNGRIKRGPEADVEEEPRLKYQRLGCDLTDVLAAGAATCLTVSDKILALATTAGSIHLLDYEGNQVRVIAAHAAPINGMAFDMNADHLASCAEDGSTLVSGMYSDETASFKHKYPVRCIALDPRYGQRKTREFVSGGDSGEVVLHSRGWLGLKDTVLHRGQGPVQATQWNSSLIAWANSKGVKVYDTSAHQRIFSIARPASAATQQDAKPHLHWEADSLLYVGWASSVTVARVVLLEETATVGSVQSHVMQTLVSLQLPASILGVAPFGQDIALLARRHDSVSDQSAELSAEEIAAMPPGHESFPELKILSWRGDELASDVLPIMGTDIGSGAGMGMSLACYYPLSKERTLQADRRLTAPRKIDYKWWPDGSEPLYYVVTPRDVVVGRPRDGDDRVAWLLQRNRFSEALKIASSDRSLRKHSRATVVAQYMAHLVEQRDFEAAARLSPELLQGDAAAWERLIYTFAQHRKLPLLAPFIPTSQPQLRRQAYEMVLTSFLASPAHHPDLLPLLKKWPPTVYSVPMLTEATLHRLQALGGKSPHLLAVAAHLYTLQGRADLALAILLRLGDPTVLAFISEHALFQAAGSHAVALMRINATGATELLVRRCDDIPPRRVVASLQAVIRSAEDGGREAEVSAWRRRLHVYLDALYCSDPGAAAEFADLQVQLYADFQPDALLPFLISGQGYSLEPALAACEARGLVSEQAHVLGRMGASSKALDIIVGSQRDVPAAISFLQASDAADEELWQHLMAVALRDADSTAQLLDSIGSHVSPLALVQQIPEGMAIPGLRDRLVRIISEYRTQTSLSEGCHVILRHDCVTLAQRMYREVRHALRSCYVHQPTVSAARLPGSSAAAPGPSQGAGGPTASTTAAAASPIVPGWQLQSGVLGSRAPARNAELPPAVFGPAFTSPTVASSAAQQSKVWVGLHSQDREDAMTGAMKRWQSATSPLDITAAELPSLVATS